MKAQKKRRLFVVLLLVIIAAICFMYFNLGQTFASTLAVMFNNPNKLTVTRKEDKANHLFALTITISNPVLVKKLYDDIYQLPLFGSGSYNCPNMMSHAEYNLIFYQNNKFIDRAIYRPSGCASVKFDDSPVRNDTGSAGSFDADFQAVTKLSRDEIVGFH